MRGLSVHTRQVVITGIDAQLLLLNCKWFHGSLYTLMLICSLDHIETGRILSLLFLVSRGVCLTLYIYFIHVQVLQGSLLNYLFCWFWWCIPVQYCLGWEGQGVESLFVFGVLKTSFIVIITSHWEVFLCNIGTISQLGKKVEIWPCHHSLEKMQLQQMRICRYTLSACGYSLWTLIEDLHLY